MAGANPGVVRLGTWLAYFADENALAMPGCPYGKVASTWSIQASGTPHLPQHRRRAGSTDRSLVGSRTVPNEPSWKDQHDHA